jgi:hypothetical protein
LTLPPEETSRAFDENFCRARLPEAAPYQTDEDANQYEKRQTHAFLSHWVWRFDARTGALFKRSN